MTQNRTVAFHTLGCKLNFSETSTIARQLAELGYQRVGESAPADIYIVNTCSVTDHADKKCRNIIRKLIRRNPQAIVAVTGCYAQLKPDEIAAIEGVDLVIGNGQKGDVAHLVAQMSAKRDRGAVYACDAEELKSFFAAFSTGDRTRAFLKVQDGCNYKCSYCTIPLARGESRNIPIDQLVEEARNIAACGMREIVITGVNTGDFGRSTGESFEQLIRALDTVEGIDRYRISSIEPNLLTDEIIEFTALSRKFMPHYHIPLQSGCDRILALMRRRYTTARFAQRIERLREVVPHVFVGIDVIVGFPGETDEDFQETYHFLEQVHPAFLHIFPYSERADTPAINFEGKVPSLVADQRVQCLTQLSDRLHAEFCQSFVGEHAQVLFESTVRGGKMFGYTENYVRVEMPYDRTLINRVAQVELTAGETPDILVGKLRITD